ncbi:MAG TPA: hypothetical protein VHF91_10285 [Acidimicrobiales bacterium]|nr:hypothetical protein [Acidimicrobiales bacterium]
MGGLLRTRPRLLVVALLFALLAACSDDDDGESATGNRFACLDFVASVTTGPNAGRAWTGDLVLTQDDTGAFTGVLVPGGQITPVPNSRDQELRGIISGPTDGDFGVYHGRNYPPYIRIISPDFN